MPAALVHVIPSFGSAFCPIRTTLPKAHDEPHFVMCKQIIDQYTNIYFVTNDREHVQAIVNAKKTLVHMAIGYEGDMNTHQREEFKRFLQNTAKCRVAAFLVMLTEEEKLQWVNNYDLFVAGL